ncbi:MAG: aromatic amino acid lyase, partial [Thermoplasmata archaeon]|nr:aromatic amino acid lyase [Thermoplasmata archaeon]
MIYVDGKTLDLEKTIRVARGHETVKLDSDARAQMEESREAVVKAIERGGETYGINTGFGELEKIVIDKKQALQLQKNLIHSHAATTGPPVEEEVIRAMMLH